MFTIVYVGSQAALVMSFLGFAQPVSFDHTIPEFGSGTTDRHVV